MNSTVISQMCYPIITNNNNEEFYIDTGPYLYFIGTVIFLEHIFIIYLTQK